MHNALISTKLYVPPAQPDGEPRLRLIERLNEGLARKLILISAPAGFGKTTLLSQWLDQCQLASAYLSLDEGDNDPARFLIYVVAALRQADPRIGATVPGAFRSLQRSSVESVLTVLVNDAAAADRDLVLVLDDYHVLGSRAIHEAVSFLLERMPPRMHLAVATRADPPLPLARLRARGQLAELRVADLAFTLDETAEFLRQMLDRELSDDDVAALETRTEGWAVGLQLAALSMKGRKDRHAFVDAFSGSQEYVADYLADEVLGQLSEDLRGFLFHTSILGRLTGPLCDAVTGQSGGRDTLVQLVRSNLFTAALDGERQWYRYHRLFADLLRRRLEESQPEIVPELHRRASLWHERHKLPSEAVEHALLADDPERATRLVVDGAETMLNRGEVATVRRWIESLPDELVKANPILCAYHAWSLLQSGQSSEDVEARLAFAPSAEAAAIRSFVTIYQGQMDVARALAQQAVESLAHGESFFATLARWTLEACELLDADLTAATSRLEELMSARQSSDNVVFTVLTLSGLASLKMRQGRLHEALAIYQRAAALASDSQGNPLPAAGSAITGLGMLRYEWNDLDEAERLVLQGIDLATRWSGIGAIDGYLALSRIRHARGDLDGARAALESARRIARQSDITRIYEVAVDGFEIDRWIARGDLDLAARRMEELGLLGEVADLETHLKGLPNVEYHFGHHRLLSVARLWLAEGHAANALGLLDSLLAVMTERNWRRNRREIELQCLRAIALQALGRIDDALAALGTALELAEPGGYARTFVDFGRPMARLLHDAAARGIRPEYAGTLLAAFPANEDVCEKRSTDSGHGFNGWITAGTPSSPVESVARNPLATPSQPGAETIEPLSQRELEVLGLISAGLTDREIAERLVLSPQTVKVHARNIYDKLDVGNRTQAAARARALGLLRE